MGWCEPAAPGRPHSALPQPRMLKGPGGLPPPPAPRCPVLRQQLLSPSVLASVGIRSGHLVLQSLAEPQQPSAPAPARPNVQSAGPFLITSGNRPLPSSQDRSSDLRKFFRLSLECSPRSRPLEITITSPVFFLSGLNTFKSFSYFSGDLASSPLTNLPALSLGSSPSLINWGPRFHHLL